MTGPRRLSNGHRVLRPRTASTASVSEPDDAPDDPRDSWERWESEERWETTDWWEPTDATDDPAVDGHDGHDGPTDHVGHRYGSAAAPGSDAVTERHAALDGRWPDSVAPAPDGGDASGGGMRADEVDPSAGGSDSPDWLLAPIDDRSGQLEVATDAVTEAIPHGRIASSRNRRRRAVWIVIAGVLVVALIGGLVVARNVFGLFFPPDYDGPGTGQVVVEVADGASTREIGEELQRDDVVASARGFGSAAEDDPNGRGIQPGFYVLRHRMSAAQAVTALLDPATRLGRADVRSGTQLDDTAGLGGASVPGVLSQISHATCEPVAGAAPRCVSVDDLRQTIATTDPADLGVPSWALDDVRRAEPARRLEGLIAPGPYDIAPGSDARAALAAVMKVSTARLEATGLVGEAERQQRDPYEVLVVASLVEKEGVAEDFGKVARVIDNRLALPMRLQLDSTINYPLDKQRLLTQPADRARPGPYNTYLDLGLPPTPIASVSGVAVAAALDPVPGPWVYFVKCQPQGQSCFAVTPAEHDANRRLAQQRGVY